MTEQEYKDLANSQPKYYYEPRGREWALYEREKDGMGGTKIFEHWNREVVRKRCYELNGWDYKSADKYCLPHQRKDEESVSFRVVEKEHISTVQDCKLAVEVTEKKAIEAAKEMIVDIFNEVHGINQTMYLEDFVARLKK